MLRSVSIDIPAGAKDYVVESTYVLPVDIEVNSVLPHAHFLGRQLEAWATLPDGRRQSLLLINDWNFDWQGDYRYVEPVKLPRGSQLSMRYVYDNSEHNARNPNRPPKRVTYGLNSSDEMGEFWLQVVTRNAEDKRILETDFRRAYGIPDAIASARAVLAKDPANATQMVSLGVALLAGGDLEQAIETFNEALAIQPDDAKRGITWGSHLRSRMIWGWRSSSGKRRCGSIASITGRTTALRRGTSSLGICRQPRITCARR